MYGTCIIFIIMYFLSLTQLPLLWLLISLSRWLTHCLFHIPLLIRLAMLVFTRILFHFAHSIATQSGFYAWKHYRWLSLQIWPNIFGNYVGMPQKRNYVDYCKLALLVMKWKKNWIIPILSQKYAFTKITGNEFMFIELLSVRFFFSLSVCHCEVLDFRFFFRFFLFSRNAIFYMFFFLLGEQNTED